MGFEVSTTGTVLSFPEGSRYAGLTVRLDEPPIGLLTTVMKGYSRFTAGNIAADEAAALVESLTEGFASVLEEWDAERKGVPVPATLAGVRSLGTMFVMGLIGAWVTGTTTVDEGSDLGKGSGSGGSSDPAPLAAMAALSSSPQSSGPQRLLSGSATGGTACRRRCSLSPPGCCGCSTFTGLATGTRTRREVSSHSRQLRRHIDQGRRRGEA